MTDLKVVRLVSTFHGKKLHLNLTFKFDLDIYLLLTRFRMEKRHHCPQCDYKSSQKSNLKRHIKAIHNKIKDFECQKCDFKCSEKRNLKKNTSKQFITRSKILSALIVVLKVLKRVI